MKRTYLKSALVITVLAGAALTGGCVTQAKYNEALAANRAVRMQLEETKESLRGYEVENQKLAEQIRAGNESVKARDEQLTLLEDHNKNLKIRFDKLAEEYRKLAGRKPEIEPFGPVSVLPSEVDKALRAFAKDNPNLLEYLPKYGMVKLKADPTFKKGSDSVEAAAVSALRKFAGIINKAAAERFNIYVAGHTDNIPIVKRETLRRHPDNWYLSVHRAVAVQKVLLRAGIAGHRVGAMGFGQHHPAAPNRASGGGNEANRRVEIWIVPPGRYLTREASESD
ncbi:MAG: OmpA family protein [Phycisphaerae bacterium]|nr:OmpA family protein [Phycisphaerae bacterium]